MATDEYSLSSILHKLQDPIPQYVLGCFPAIATIGASPNDYLLQKLLWMARCLACPFLGLFYTCNIANDEKALYWLPKICFIGEDGSEIPYRPFGHRAMSIDSSAVSEKLEACIANSSVLERLSSLLSVFFILLGAFAGISMVVRWDLCEDWPYIPVALSWTLPAIAVRISNGRMLVKDPKKKIGDEKIKVKQFDNDKAKKHKSKRVVITAFASIVFPWISVIMAYFSPPIGFFCRSKYLTIFCTIWSFNNIIAYIHHWVEEKNKIVDRIIRIWFSVSGIVVGILLLVLAVLSDDRSWWATMSSLYYLKPFSVKMLKSR
ncbi:574_t:CDS:2 [Ambispora gerdemannii]|uniref:574_t:CDS:1 n=1 Tax=Ambispora gerdemannii TaxID=144530 RepID=A0A9N8ZKM5_9GLOM|nr:574_t:CDS:2 [Ambispora gerdemannii]